MYLSEFLFGIEERFEDSISPDSCDLAEVAACNIVELINRHFNVSEFLELIYTESCNFELQEGLSLGRSENDCPF